MENASKAIIMAGGILIAIIIMSLLVMLFSQIGSVYQGDENSKLIEQIAKENRKFDKYNNNKGLYGSELLSLANLLEEYNRKLLDSVGGEGHENDPFYQENDIEIKVRIGYIQIADKVEKDELGNTKKDESGNDKKVKDKYGKIMKDVINNKGTLSGTFEIEKLLGLISNEKVFVNEYDYELDIIAFKNTPFKLKDTKYYDSGLIKYMEFEQAI